MERKIIYYGNYFSRFYETQNNKIRDKIDYVIDIVKYIERVPIQFLKHLEGTESLYEIRVSTTFKQIRIFCFFDEGQVVVLTNCFVKKTQKTPKKELELAKKLKKEYFKTK
ncbi:MAG: type II toxin-antitoxin system RelE/ParE family toxin [Cyclobacteriaceae bacterium]|nr:type II toxin-antitoxin system RelE/ParE family toxin [Cyclobacteriaceae bacterium]MCK5206745.1 type II toxin-antitoxin system RelE/ParE family toxin [Cyclobacteriaceae bacterium]MCK5279441.1 type II toxin-antitoxin system RelE/ParE family toxin [Cyclobacteriaceae bacterium]MCK5370744.1 type II toxin-antitoxin system RelE/ParE family toxin [Cyclobacteriaceae bacterium]MCK5701422.1 type II toxin-antitoxin system RelE/ParE family toxin [Cyclobacteriaceae bacterium]